MDRTSSVSVAPTLFGVLPRAAVWLVWAVSGLGVAPGVLTFVYGALNHQSLNDVLNTVAFQAVWAMSFPLVGAVIATHRPPQPTRLDVPGHWAV
jgi:tellurite resistance protein TehA-like permease